MEGLQDGHPGGMNTSCRLQSVIDRRKAWRQFAPTSERIVPITASSRTLSARSHFGWTSGQHTLNIVQMPSTFRGIPYKSWSIDVHDVTVDFENVDDDTSEMVMCPDQNLLAIVEMR